MDDDGEYKLTVVDHLGDMTFSDQKVPDHFVTMIPVMFEQLRRQT